MQIKALALLPLASAMAALAAPAASETTEASAAPWTAYLYSSNACNSKGGYLAEVDGEAGKQYYSDDFTQETVRSIQFRYGTADPDNMGFAAVYDHFTAEEQGDDGYYQVGSEYGSACITATTGYDIDAFKTKACKLEECNGPPEPDNE